MRGSWWHCACGSLPVLFFSSHASSCLSSNPLPANPFHQSIQPACLGGCCSLAIDALIAVGHIEKIVLLVVILPGDKGTKWGAKAGNSLHVRKAQARDHCNMSRQLLFCCSSPFTSKTLLPKTKENSGPALLLHTGREFTHLRKCTWKATARLYCKHATETALTLHQYLSMVWS